MTSEPHYVVRRTLLSGRPRPRSALVATFATAALFVTSGYWFADPWNVAAEAGALFTRHEYWRLFTAMIVHRDLGHLGANAFPWWGFAFLLYGYFGPWVFPGGVILLGALVNLLSIATYPIGDRLIGASGAVYLMAGFWLVLYLLIDRRFRMGRRWLHAAGFALVLLAPQGDGADANTSHRTHAIGFAVGALWAAIYFLVKRRRIRAAETLVREAPSDPWALN